MKTIKHTKTAKLPMYNCSFHFIATNNVVSIVDTIYKKHNIKEEFLDEVEGVVISPDILEYYMLVDLKYMSYNTIAHEIYHSVVRITEDRDIVDEETQAWLCGHLSEIVHKFIIKKGLTIKNGS